MFRKSGSIPHKRIEVMGLVGKKCKIFFEDCGVVKPRIAVVVEEDVVFTTIRNEYGTEAIPTCKIVRVEVLG